MLPDSIIKEESYEIEHQRLAYEGRYDKAKKELSAIPNTTDTKTMEGLDQLALQIRKEHQKHPDKPIGFKRRKKILELYLMGPKRGVFIQAKMRNKTRSELTHYEINAVLTPKTALGDLVQTFTEHGKEKNKGKKGDPFWFYHRH